MTPEARAGWIGRAGAGQRGLEHLCRRAHDAPFQTFERNPVAGLDDRAPGPGVESRVLLENQIYLTARLYVRSMVDEFLDRNARGELGKSADMIAVEVSGDHVIDLRHPGIPDRGHDAIGVADRGITAVSRVVDDGFAGWRDPQLGIAAFHVDDVDVERFRHGPLCCWKRPRKRNGRYDRHQNAHRASSLIFRNADRANDATFRHKGHEILATKHTKATKGNPQIFVIFVSFVAPSS